MSDERIAPSDNGYWRCKCGQEYHVRSLLAALCAADERPPEPANRNPNDIYALPKNVAEAVRFAARTAAPIFNLFGWSYHDGHPDESVLTMAIANLVRAIVDEPETLWRASGRFVVQRNRAEEGWPDDDIEISLKLSDAQVPHDRDPAGVAERRDPLEPATEIKMLALVNELLTWAFDQATLDKEALQRAAEILLDDLLYLAGFREPSALRAIDLRGAGPQPIRSALEQIAEKLEYNAGGSFPGWIRRELSELALLARGALRAGGPAPEETIRSMAEFRKKFFPDTEPAESRPSTWSGGGPAREEPTEDEVKKLLRVLETVLGERDRMRAALETVDDCLGDHTSTNHESQAESDRCDLCAALDAVRRALSSGLPAPESEEIK